MAFDVRHGWEREGSTPHCSCTYENARLEVGASPVVDRGVLERAGDGFTCFHLSSAEYEKEL